jgi:hypothetical protein
MYSESEYRKYFQAFKDRQPMKWAKFDTPEQEEFLITQLMASDRLPSETTCELMIQQLAKQGWLMRVDGSSASADREVYLRAAIAKVDAPELTPSELEYFSGLSQVELVDRYWEHDSRNEFAVRYAKASRTFGFVIPPRPAAAAKLSVTPIPLTAEEYHALKANEVCRRLKDPRFKAAVDKLIAEHKI